MNQEVKKIRVEELVLWTENPRDPISSTAQDQNVVDRAVADPNSKWNLSALAHEMGDYFDYSELPTVVYEDDKPIVYDGNRRVVLAKLKLGYVSAPGLTISLPYVEEEIPCNVCSKDIALRNVYRKHVVSGNSWDPLERDIFASRYLGEDKSIFMLLDENTNGYISLHPELNQGFVKKEIFTASLLEALGIRFENGKLQTRHSSEELGILLDDLRRKIKEKQITTRVNRARPLDVLDQRSKDIIRDNGSKNYHEYNHPIDVPDKKPDSVPPTPRKAPVTKGSKRPIFGCKLVLKFGDVNDFYRDICTMYEYIESNSSKFSPKVFVLIRMSMRMLVETAAKDEGLKDMAQYVAKHFTNAKKTLSQDDKTFLSAQNVTDTSMLQLLNVGAHSYLQAIAKDQTLAMSIIIGAMLTISHGK